jgi:hypothetical protein
MAKEAYLDPAKTIIERLGGVDEVAALTGAHRTRVFRWMYPSNRGGTGGVIPQRYFRVLLDHAESNGILMTADEFLFASAVMAASSRLDKVD